MTQSAARWSTALTRMKNLEGDCSERVARVEEKTKLLMRKKEEEEEVRRTGPHNGRPTCMKLREMAFSFLVSIVLKVSARWEETGSRSTSV